MSTWTEEQVPPSQTPSGQTVPQRAAVVRVAAEVDADPTAVGLGQHAGQRRRGADTPFADLIGSAGVAAGAAVARVDASGRHKPHRSWFRSSTQAIGGALQIPPSQTPSGQTLPQAPQLFGSLLRSMQKPLHSTRGETQPRLICGQTPLAQTPSGQTLPQPPQLFGSLLMSTHPPPPQSTVGRTQPISTWTGKQVPPSQTPLSQAMPHAATVEGVAAEVDAPGAAVGQARRRAGLPRGGGPRAARKPSGHGANGKEAEHLATRGASSNGTRDGIKGGVVHGVLPLRRTRAGSLCPARASEDLRAQRSPVHIAWCLVLAHATAVVPGCQVMPLIPRLTGRGFTRRAEAEADTCQFLPS